MDVEKLDRVYESFRGFHAFFALAFGRRQWQEHSRHYLQAPLVQSQERRNAENLAALVPVSPRALQCFLTEAPWDDDAVIARLQEYLGSRWPTPWRCESWTGAIFPSRGSSPWG